MQLLSAIAASSDGQHSVNACTGEVRLVVVVEVVCEQDVECRLVVSVAVTVPPALTVKFAEDIGGRRDARTLQRTEKPPPKHAVIELDTTHRNTLLYSQIQHTETRCYRAGYNTPKHAVIELDTTHRNTLL